MFKSIVLVTTIRFFDDFKQWSKIFYATEVQSPNAKLKVSTKFRRRVWISYKIIANNVYVYKYYEK